MARARRILGDDHPATLVVSGNLAECLRQLGRYDHARELHEDALIRSGRVLGKDHPITLDLAHALALNLWHLGQKEQARQLDEDTLTRSRRVLGDDHPVTPETYPGLGPLPPASTCGPAACDGTP